MVNVGFVVQLLRFRRCHSRITNTELLKTGILTDTKLLVSHFHNYLRIPINTFKCSQ